MKSIPRPITLVIVNDLPVQTAVVTGSGGLVLLARPGVTAAQLLAPGGVR